MTPKEIRRRINALLSATAGLPPMDRPTMDAFYYDAAMKAAELIDAEELKGQLIVDLVAGQTDYLAPSDLAEFVDVQWLNVVDGAYETLHNVELSTLGRCRLNEQVYARAGVYRVAGADYGKKIIRLALAPEQSQTAGMVLTYRLKPSKLASIGEDDEIVDFSERVLSVIPYHVAFQWFSLQGAPPIKELGAQYGQYFESECAGINKKLGDLHQRDVRREIHTDWGGITL